MKIAKNLVKLLTNKGFYILLALSIGVVGIAGYVANLKLQREASEAQTRQAAEESSYTLPPKKQEKSVNTPEKPKPIVTVSETDTVAVAKSEDIKAKSIPSNDGFILPLQGEMMQEYSPEQLVKSKTMNDWRVHPGVDIRGDIGAQVKAAAAGIVTKAYFDDMLGVTVVIQHADGIETIYSNLQTAMLVEEEQEVSQGTVIGGVGVTAPSEISEPPHLHFEMKKDGLFINPFDYID